MIEEITGKRPKFLGHRRETRLARSYSRGFWMMLMTMATMSMMAP